MLLFSTSQILALLVSWRFLFFNKTFALCGYGLVFPAFFAFMGALMLPDEILLSTPKLSGFQLKCEGLLLFFLSPFPAWYFLTGNNVYLYTCAALFVYISSIAVYQLLSYCKTLGDILANTTLRRIAMLTRLFWFLFLLLPIFIISGCWHILNIVESSHTPLLDLFFVGSTPIENTLCRGTFTLVFIGLVTSAFASISTALFTFDHLNCLLERQDIIIDYLQKNSDADNTNKTDVSPASQEIPLP